MKLRRLPYTYVVVSLGLYAASVAAAPLAAPATPSVVPAAQSSPLQPLGTADLILHESRFDEKGSYSRRATQVVSVDTKPRSPTPKMAPFHQNPDGRWFSGRSAVLQGLGRGTAIHFALRLAYHPGKPSARPCGIKSAVPLSGTLFFTEAERRAMDKARTDQSQSTTDRQPGAKAPGLINGVVKRSDGKGTVWVDGAPIAGGAGQATTSKMVGKPLHTVTEITAPTSPKRAAKPSP
ncbi:MAG: hypothetical protein JNM52_09070 [Betaproteobacteria bacterium]|nr:hypothetical protein [Betaproteobacteria bacterium]